MENKASENPQGEDDDIQTKPTGSLLVSGSPYSWRVLLTLEVKRLAYNLAAAGSLEGGAEEAGISGSEPARQGADAQEQRLRCCGSRWRSWITWSTNSRSPRFSAAQPISRKIRRLISEVFLLSRRSLQRIITAIYFGKAAEKADDIRAAAAVAHAELERFEGISNDSPWFGGESICAADIAIYPFVKSLLRAASKETAAPLDLGVLPFEARYPRFAAWMQRVEQLRLTNAPIRRTGGSKAAARDQELRGRRMKHSAKTRNLKTTFRFRRLSVRAGHRGVRAGRAGEPNQDVRLGRPQGERQGVRDLLQGKIRREAPGKRVDAIVASGKGDYFDPGHGRPSKEWLQCPGKVRPGPACQGSVPIRRGREKMTTLRTRYASKRRSRPCGRPSRPNGGPALQSHGRFGALHF